MESCIMFGGAGYIGTKLASFFIEHNLFKRIIIADLNRSSLEGLPAVYSVIQDVREKIKIENVEDVSWVFNLAAIHREPGHLSDEYFETNILGAENICAFARHIRCENIFFFSSISVYGPTLKATDEKVLPTPNTPYGISKLSAEYIHKIWAFETNKRRLVIVRPGVIYGPGDPGNILRMIRAVKKGYFLLPVTPTIKKSYGYIFGLIDSISFMMKQEDKVITYNYVERETETLGDMINSINKTLGYNGRKIRVPFVMLKIAAFVIWKIKPGLNGIHPDRVKKVARPTHIVPAVLMQMGFNFRFDFKSSLTNWRSFNHEI